MKKNLTFLLIFLVLLMLLEVPGGIVGMLLDLWGDRYGSYILGAGLVALPALGAAFIVARRLAMPSKLTAGLMFSALLAGAALHFGIGLEPPEGKFLLAPDIDTRFAPGYSDQGFAEVRIGMTESSVLALLGEPISRQEPSGWPFPGDASVIWWYSCDGACKWADFAWRAPIVGLKNGFVVSKWTTWCFD
jgi:hypothetical protein